MAGHSYIRIKKAKLFSDRTVFMRPGDVWNPASSEKQNPAIWSWLSRLQCTSISTLKNSRWTLKHPSDLSRHGFMTIPKYWHTSPAWKSCSNYDLTIRSMGKLGWMRILFIKRSQNIALYSNNSPSTFKGYPCKRQYARHTSWIKAQESYAVCLLKSRQWLSERKKISNVRTRHSINR